MQLGDVIKNSAVKFEATKEGTSAKIEFKRNYIDITVNGTTFSIDYETELKEAKINA